MINSLNNNDNDVIWYMVEHTTHPPPPISVNKKVLKECKILVILYFRAYPSLKLRINVNAARNEVDVVMPGLRYDDIDFTGMLVVAKKITHTI